MLNCRLDTRRRISSTSGADAGFRVGGGGGAKGRGYKRGWVREGATASPSPTRGYGGVLYKLPPRPQTGADTGIRYSIRGVSDMNNLY